jgi:nucleotide-binding universal stress UspA family protein
MKSILLPTDFSENSWNAIRYALRFFETSICHFYLLHVSRLSDLTAIDIPYIPSEQDIEDKYLKHAKIQLRQLLRKISEELPQNKKHKFHTISDYNYFVESIRNHVSEKKIDIIVMGTKGATGLKKFIIGSNTGDVITKVHCTTLVVPENARFTSIKQLAFPTDLALSYNIQTLQHITEILEEFGSFLKILHINKKEEDLNFDQLKYKELLEDYFNDKAHSFHFIKDNNIEDAIQCFVHSRDIDMIAMVAKNLNYFQRILFLPTVEEISYHTDVPFLVLHE